jgi:hypothetical protein
MTSIDDPAAVQVEDLAPHLDLFDPSHSERLWEVLAYARSACPVLRTDADEGYYIVTRYDELRTVLEDAETYSSQPRTRPGISSTAAHSTNTCPGPSSAGTRTTSATRPVRSLTSWCPAAALTS